jgi:FkbM family methyltransferase
MNVKYYPRKDVEPKLNPYFLNRVAVPERIKVYTIPARKLLFHPLRFDIMIKYLYVKYRECGIDIPFIHDLYALHIRKNDGSYFEADGSKHSLECYVNSFHETIDSIRNHGFDPETTIIPVNSDKQVLDGAHRVAACAYFDTNVTVAEFDYLHDFSYKFFLNQRKIPQEFLDFTALNYCILNENAYIVNLRPIAEGLDSEAEKIIERYGRIYYKKEIDFTITGNILCEYLFYKTEKWIGTPEDGFSGARSRAEKLSQGKSPTRVYVFECVTLQKVKEAKKLIRDIYKMGNDSVHITDTREETLDLARLYFNNNTLHLFNKTRYPKRDFLRLFQSFRHWLQNSHVNFEEVVVDGSSVMTLYGLRQSHDIDYLAHGTANKELKSDLFDRHDQELGYHAYSKQELIYDPRFHLYFENIKFISLDVLIKMKECRGEIPKDYDDINLINSVLNNKRKSLITFDTQSLRLRFKFLPRFLKIQFKKIVFFLAPDGSLRRKILSKINAFCRQAAGLLSNPKVIYFRLLPGGVHSVNYCGYRLFFSKKTSIVERYLTNRSYEPHVVDALHSILDSTQGPKRILDIGANIGMISLALIRHCPNAEIFAFEPGPHQAGLLRKTIRENRLGNKVHQLEIALSDSRGEATFSIHSSEHASGDGFMDTGRAGKSQTLVVKTDTLDQWWHENNKPQINLVKMDVEGAELLVMRGGKNFFSQLKPPIVFEIHQENLKPYPYSSLDIIKFLEGYGYTLLNLDGNALGGNQRKQLLIGKYSGELLAIICKKA